MSTPELNFPNSFDTFLAVPSVVGKPEIHARLTSLRDIDEMDMFFAQNPYLREFQPFTRDINSPEDTRRNVTDALRNMAADEWMQYRIIEGVVGEPGPIRGTVTLYDHNPDTLVSTAGVGFYVAQEHQRLGHASRATSTVLEYAQEIWGLHSVYFEIAEDNKASERVAERLGATLLPLAPTRLIPSGDRLLNMRTWGKDYD